MTLRLAVALARGVHDPREMEGAPRLVLACDACGEPIARAADGLVVWSAPEAWAGDGRPDVIHAACLGTALPERFAWRERANVRTAPLADLLVVLVRGLGVGSPRSEQVTDRT